MMTTGNSHSAVSYSDSSETENNSVAFVKPQIKADLIKRRLRSSRPTPRAGSITKLNKLEGITNMHISTIADSSNVVAMKMSSEPPASISPTQGAEQFTPASPVGRENCRNGHQFVSRVLSDKVHRGGSAGETYRNNHLEMEVESLLPRKQTLRKAPPTVKRKKTHQLSIIPFTTKGSASSKDPSTSKPSTGHTKAVRRNIRGETPLHVAAIKGDLSAVRALLQQGADPNAKDNAGWTPLHEACNHGHLPVVKVLLSSGALVNTPGFENDTPLHDAVINGHVEIASLLLSQGANYKLRNCHGKTPDALAVAEPMARLFRDHHYSSPTICVSPESVRKMHASPQLSGRPSKVVLLGTGLKMYQKNQLEEMSALLGAEVVNTFSEEVSHVITICDKSGCCPRTLKFLCAVASGKWIVSFQWVSKCIEQRCWVNEEPYEACGVNTGDSTLLSDAPRKGRLNKAEQAPGLFDGCEFYFSGDFPPPRASKEDLMYLAQLSGGKVLTREPRACDQQEVTYPFHAKHLPIYSKYIVYDPCTDKIPARNGDKSVATVPASWLLDCLSHFELVNIFNPNSDFTL